MTKGTALALKSRALLYAASMLHNPSQDADKWKAAADAAYAIIKENWYSLPKTNADPLYDKNGGNDDFEISAINHLSVEMEKVLTLKQTICLSVMKREKPAMYLPKIWWMLFS